MPSQASSCRAQILACGIGAAPIEALPLAIFRNDPRSRPPCGGNRQGGVNSARMSTLPLGWRIQRPNNDDSVSSLNVDELPLRARPATLPHCRLSANPLEGRPARLKRRQMSVLSGDAVLIGMQAIFQLSVGGDIHTRVRRVTQGSLRNFAQTVSPAMLWKTPQCGVLRRRPPTTRRNLGVNSRSLT